LVNHDEFTDGSEGQFLSHPIEVENTVTGGLHYGQAVLTILVEGVRKDDTSISALPGIGGGSYGPSPEAEVGTTCEEQVSLQDAQDDGEGMESRESVRKRRNEELDRTGVDGLELAQTAFAGFDRDPVLSERTEYNCWERDKCRSVTEDLIHAISQGHRNAAEFGNPEALLRELKYRIQVLQKKRNHRKLQKLMSLVPARIWG
jgi:hypothetical protein